MKTSGAVYRKLKEIKFRHLISLYRKYLKRSPENCKYNYPYNFTGGDGDKYQLRLCLCHQENVQDSLQGIIPHLVDVCEQLEDCQTCNAFVSRLNRDDIKKKFEDELATKSIRESKYPDICALEWVLERTSVGILPRNKLGILIDILKKILKIKNNRSGSNEL